MASTLEQLKDAPHDRELALVYADWLQGQGHPRGELIAVQDAAQRCASLEELEAARARAIELVATSEELRPTSFDELGEAELRPVWAQWQRGFIRRLELLITDSVGRWPARIRELLDHPSLALLENLLIRVDARGEPLDEVQAAFQIARSALASRARPPGPRPALQLDLWTGRTPGFERRQQLAGALPSLTPFWFGLDITVIPPPAGSAPLLVRDRLQQLSPSADDRPFDLVWLDDRGQFFGMFEAWVGVHRHDLQGLPQLRRMAEQRSSPNPVAEDHPVERRIARLFDGFASRWDRLVGPDPVLAPRRPWPQGRPQPVALVEGLRRLGHSWRADVPGALVATLAPLRTMQWFVVEHARGDRGWSSLIGLGPGQVLELSYREA